MVHFCGFFPASPSRSLPGCMYRERAKRCLPSARAYFWGWIVMALLRQPSLHCLISCCCCWANGYGSGTL